MRPALLFPGWVSLLPLLILGCEPSPPAEILWDSYGVPHLYADGPEELFFAHGWAQMESHADLILRLYGEARGRASEYWGEDGFASDLWVHLNSVPDRSRDWWNLQDDEMRRWVEAFVSGMNAFAEQHPETIAEAVRVVLPVRPEDVLSHSMRTIHFTFMAGPGMVPTPFREGLMARRVSRGGGGAGSSGAGAEAVTVGEAAYGSPGTSGATGDLGSNGWAIAPGRSASGSALLLGNSHFPWGGVYTWYEASLHAPAVNAHGAGLVGTPLLNIAFNDFLGWTHTVNTYDGADLYELALVEGGYLFDEEIRSFETRIDTVLVKLQNGEVEARTLEVRHSVHGPVVGELGDRALALRVAALDAPHMGRQLWRMVTATNLREFEAAMSMLQLPLMTTMYADRDGHILHLFNGRVPVRGAGDFSHWRGIVPGTESETLWTETHPYGDLPRVVDPETGWLQNTNDPPWTTTIPFPLDPSDFPPYMAPTVPMHFRAQQSSRMLLEDDAITFAEMESYKHSTRMELADRILDELVAAAKMRGGEAARAAAAVLEAWDRNADVDSRGAVLFLAWLDGYQQQTGGNLFAVPWDPGDPLGTPVGLRDPAMAVAVLEGASREVQAQLGTMDAAFGDVHRIRRDQEDLPSNGYRGTVGTFRAGWYAPSPDGRFELVGGDTFVLLAELGDPVRARTALVYGNASQPGSPHRTDQLKLFSDKRLKPVWRTRAEVEENLEKRTVLEMAEGGGG